MKNTKITITSQTRQPNGRLKQEFKFEFPFINRETYLEWVKEWKVKYAELTAEIRASKAVARNSKNSQEERSWAQLSLSRYKYEATMLCAMRRASKVEAQNQYLTNKQKAA